MRAQKRAARDTRFLVRLIFSAPGLDGQQAASARTPWAMGATRLNLPNKLRCAQVEYVEDLEEDDSDIEDAAEWGGTYWGALGSARGEGVDMLRGEEGDERDSGDEGDDDDGEAWPGWRGIVYCHTALVSHRSTMRVRRHGEKAGREVIVSRGEAHRCESNIDVLDVALFFY